MTNYVNENNYDKSNISEDNENDNLLTSSDNLSQKNKKSNNKDAINIEENNLDISFIKDNYEESEVQKITSDEDDKIVHISNEIPSTISDVLNTSFIDTEEDESSSSVDDREIENEEPKIIMKSDINENKSSPLPDKINENNKVLLDRNLLNIGIDVKKSYTEIDLHEIKIENKSFNEKIVLSNIPLEILIEYSPYNEHSKNLMNDKIAQMIYTLGQVGKALQFDCVPQYESLFYQMYEMNGCVFKKITGYTFKEFVLRPFCKPYFNVKLNDELENCIIIFNTSDKELIKLGNDITTSRKVYDKILEKKIIDIDKKMENIKNKVDFCVEKIRWLAVLACAPKDVEIIPVNDFREQFYTCYKENLTKEYLSSKFIRNKFSGVIKYYFSEELEFINQPGTCDGIKIICDIDSKIIEIKKEIEYLSSDEYLKKKEKIKNCKVKVKSKKKVVKKVPWKDTSIAHEILNSIQKK